MSSDDPVGAFVDRVDRLEERFRGDRYADYWLMPRELMIALRDELKKDRVDDLPLFAAVDR